jgi:hypothetical protein
MVAPTTSPPSFENGNILVYVLIGIVLIGLLTAALSQNSDGGKDVDQERLLIRATEIQRYAAQVQKATTHVIQTGISETDLRFAHPKAANDYGTITTNPPAQVFHPDGGATEYRLPPVGIQETAGEWEFFGTSHIPQVGSDRADLIMVLPNVTLDFCTTINRQLGFDMEEPLPDGVGSSSCVYTSAASTRFDGEFSTPANALSGATFTRLPAQQACVACGTDYHYYYVLLAR